MSRQYFSEIIIDPPTANLTAITAAGETGMWNVAQFTPIHAFDAYRGVGKIYRVSAGGILTTAASTPGTVQITPRIGTTTSGITLGASLVSGTLPTSLASVPWTLDFRMIVRTLGAPGANSTCIGTGIVQFPSLNASPVGDFPIFFGGTSATVDFSVETGVFIGWNFSAATNTLTPQYAFIQSLN